MSCTCRIPTTICPNFRHCGISTFVLEPETPAPEQPKFCRDCLHCDKPNAEDWREQSCHRPRPDVYNLVTGKKIAYHYDCEYERYWQGKPQHPDEGERCGKEGRYWEARPTEPAPEAKPARRRRRKSMSGQPSS